MKSVYQYVETMRVYNGSTASLSPSYIFYCPRIKFSMLGSMFIKMGKNLPDPACRLSSESNSREASQLKIKT